MAKDEELAYSIVWKIVESEKRPDYGTVRLRYMEKAKELRDETGIDISYLFEKVISRFPRDSKTGVFSLPEVIERPRPSNQVAKELASKIPSKLKGPPSEIIEAAQRFLTMKDKMTLIADHLARWKSNPDAIIQELDFVYSDEFFTAYKDPPATFEFICAKAASTLFQIPLHVKYRSKNLPSKESVVWRGKCNLDPSGESYSAVGHAPGGGPDIVIRARGYYVLLEATLRCSPRQWKEEIEPIFRHAKEAEERLPEEPIYLVFVTPEGVLQGTYDWIQPKSRTSNVLALDIKCLRELVRTSTFIAGLPHAEILRLLGMLHKFTQERMTSTSYLSHELTCIKQWCGEVLRPYLDTFLATKAFLVTKSIPSGFARITNVVKTLMNDPEVHEYFRLSGVAKADDVGKELQGRKDSMSRYMSLFGLAKVVNDHFRILSQDEFENRLLKMYSQIRKGWETKAKAD